VLCNWQRSFPWVQFHIWLLRVGAVVLMLPPFQRGPVLVYKGASVANLRRYSFVRYKSGSDPSKTFVTRFSPGYTRGLDPRLPATLELSDKNNLDRV
jgi:hypothetical protein